MRELLEFEIGDTVDYGSGSYRVVRHIKIKKDGVWLGFGYKPLGLVPAKSCKRVSALKRTWLS